MYDRWVLHYWNWVYQSYETSFRTFLSIIYEDSCHFDFIFSFEYDGPFLNLLRSKLYDRGCLYRYIKLRRSVQNLAGNKRRRNPKLLWSTYTSRSKSVAPNLLTMENEWKIVNLTERKNYVIDSITIRSNYLNVIFKTNYYLRGSSVEGNQRK